jgi:hypothetical protein
MALKTKWTALARVRERSCAGSKRNCFRLLNIIFANVVAIRVCFIGRDIGVCGARIMNFKFQQPVGATERQFV